MLYLSNISKRLDKTLVLDNISFDLPNRGMVVLTGPNGAGKSLLLGIMSGLDLKHDGAIIYDGETIDKKIVNGIVKK